MKRKQIFANITLLLCALIWGMAFVAQSVATEYVGAFTFQALRSVLAVIVLLPVVLIRRKRSAVECTNERTNDLTDDNKRKTKQRSLLFGGAACGIVLCTASCLQQIGIQYTTAGRAGFLTSLYLIIVTLFCVIGGRKIGKGLGVGVILATIGIYLMSGSTGFGLSGGDILMLMCAVVFALHIMLVDYFVKQTDPVELSCVQFLFSAILSTVLMFLFEHPEPAMIRNAGISILYAGIMSSGVAYTLQIVGQKYAKPAMATLLMSFESVFSMIGGILFLTQIPSGRELTGCIIMFAAVLISQFSGMDHEQTAVN